MVYVLNVACRKFSKVLCVLTYVISPVLNWAFSDNLNGLTKYETPETPMN